MRIERIEGGWVLAFYKNKRGTGGLPPIEYQYKTASDTRVAQAVIDWLGLDGFLNFKEGKR